MSIKKSISVTFAGQIINTFTAFISSIIITRMLGAEGRGDYVIYINALTMASVWLGFSLPSSIVYYASGNKLDNNRMLITMLQVCIGTTLLLALSLPIIFSSHKQWLIFPDQYQTYIWQGLFIVQFFFNQVTSVLSGFLVAHKIFIPQTIFTAAMGVLNVLAWLALYYQLIPIGQYNFGLIIIVLLLFSVPPMLYNFYLLRVKTPISFTLKSLPWIEFRKMIKFALLIYGCHTLQSLNYKMDLWVVDYYYGKSEVGIYSLAVQLAQLVWLLPTAMATILYSFISNTASLKEATDMTIKYARWAFYATVVIAVVSYVIFYFAIPVIYGQAFKAARNLIPFLFIGIVPFSIIIIFGSFVAGTNRLFINFIITVINCVITASLYFILIPKFGSLGASIATSISYLSTIVLFF